MSLLLLRQITQLFIILLMGFGVVKAGVLKSEDSRPLSMILLYLIMSCAIVNSFLIQRTPETSRMMLVSFCTAIFVNLLMVVMTIPFGKVFRLSIIEKASVIYPNAINMTIPLVNALLGPEWIVYISMYSIVQTVLVWTHGRILISGERKVSVKKILLNINIIAIFIGFVMFVFQLPMPSMLKETMSQVTAMIGPTAMLIVGMLMASVDFGQIRKYLKIWRVVLLRLIVYPVIVVLLLKYSGIARLAPNGETLMMITLISATAPSANVVTQFSQIYDREPEYASLINAVTMLCCIVTMPLMIFLYQM